MVPGDPDVQGSDISIFRGVQRRRKVPARGLLNLCPVYERSGQQSKTQVLGKDGPCADRPPDRASQESIDSLKSRPRSQARYVEDPYQELAVAVWLASQRKANILGSLLGDVLRVAPKALPPDSAFDEKRDADTRPIWEIVMEIGDSVPEEEWAKVPSDLARNLDHYLYGAPKDEE